MREKRKLILVLDFIPYLENERHRNESMKHWISFKEGIYIEAMTVVIFSKKMCAYESYSKPCVLDYIYDRHKYKVCPMKNEIPTEAQ